MELAVTCAAQTSRYFNIEQMYYGSGTEVTRTRRSRGQLADAALHIAQNPLHTFPRNFSMDVDVVMEFGKRHDTTDTTDFYGFTRANLLQTCCGLVVYIADL